MDPTGRRRTEPSPRPDLDQLLEWVWKIEPVIDSLDLPAVFCHNDTVPQNFIRTGDELRLVDWDYAGRGLAVFELASFCATADLNRGGAGASSCARMGASRNRPCWRKYASCGTWPR